jgi:hypothetical protein
LGQAEESSPKLYANSGKALEESKDKMPINRKRVSEEVMDRVSAAIRVLAKDDSLPRTKRQLELISGLSHDAVARAFRQDAAEPDTIHQINASFDDLVAPLGGGRRSPFEQERHNDKQEIVVLKQQIKELNKQLDRYAMALFAQHLMREEGSQTPTNTVPLRGRKMRND